MTVLMLKATDSSADGIVASLRNLVTTSVTAASAAPLKPVRHPVKMSSPAGQRELPFFGVVRKAPSEESKAPQSEKIEVPTAEEDVDFDQPLTWFSGLKGRNKKQTNRAAVWVAMMLIAGGLHYKEAAQKLGVTPGAFKTFRTRADIPSDTDRRKMGRVFDLDTAKVTLTRSGYEMRKCLRSGYWFWAKKADRGTRYAPQFRTHERIIGQSGNKFTIITGAMLASEKSTMGKPFAKLSERMSS